MGKFPLCAFERRSRLWWPCRTIGMSPALRRTRCRWDVKQVKLLVKHGSRIPPWKEASNKKWFAKKPLLYNYFRSWSIPLVVVFLHQLLSSPYTMHCPVEHWGQTFAFSGAARAGWGSYLGQVADDLCIFASRMFCQIFGKHVGHIEGSYTWYWHVLECVWGIGTVLFTHHICEWHMHIYHIHT